MTLAHRVFAIVSPATLALLTWCVRHRADGGVPYNLRRVSGLAAALQERTIADVVSAVPLDTAQRERLRNLLRERVGTGSRAQPRHRPRRGRGRACHRA